MTPAGGGGAMGIYERQRHMQLASAGMWGDHPFRPDGGDALAAAVAPPLTAVPAAAVDVVLGAETEVKFTNRMVSNYTLIYLLLF